MVDEPETLSLYINDVADKIHENYLKNGNTLIYCYDGTLNSIALVTGNRINYILSFPVYSSPTQNLITN